MRRPSNYKTVEHIKQQHPTLKIVAIVHDFGTQFNRYGSHSRYFFTGWKYRLFFLQKPGYWFLNKFIYIPSIKRGIKAMDMIITSSNYSMQKITRYPVCGDIIPHYLSLYSEKSSTQRSPQEKYFLFVSANRPVKNFLSTLEAFCAFKKTEENDYYLYVTGLNEQTLSNLLRYRKVDKGIVDKWVRVFGYVKEEELENLYLNCGLLLFTSKFEGFGLPLLEAARYGKPSIASFAASIPEILGSCTHYVNSYCAQSITDAMHYMTQDDILKQYEKWVSACYPLLEKRAKLDLEVVIQHIVGV
jgi:glycosyltransferase involved in cell wall biosynthesis